MKNYALIALTSLISLSAQCASYNCVAGRQNLINFQTNFQADKIILVVTNSNEIDVLEDLKDKRVNLKYTEMNYGWKKYIGVLKVNNYNDYRHFELAINPSTLIGSNILKGHLALSPQSSEYWPVYLNHYDLNCSLK